MSTLNHDIPIKIHQLANNIRPRSLAPVQLRRLSRLAKRTGNFETHQKIERAISLIQAGKVLPKDEYEALSRGALAGTILVLDAAIQDPKITLPPKTMAANALCSIHKALTPVDNSGSGIAIQINLVSPMSGAQPIDIEAIPEG